jgi:hypothetical protein
VQPDGGPVDAAFLDDGSAIVAGGMGFIARFRP